MSLDIRPPHPAGNQQQITANRAGPTQSQSHAIQAMGVSVAAMAADPMMVLIEVAYARSQSTLSDLTALAEEQKQANTLMESLRKAEKVLRDALTRSSLSSSDLAEIEALAREAGVWDAISAPVDSLKKAIEATPDKVNVWIDPNSKEHYHMDRVRWIDAIKEGLKEAKENVKGQSANRELDMQRLTQEYSTSSQLASNLLKRQNDTALAIIRHLAG